MSWFRLTVLALSMALLGTGCSCARPPVSNTLKADGEACGTDEECESSLCDKLPGKASVCFRKCAAGCKPGDICTALANNDRFACVNEKPGLCQPCALNIDCPYPGDRCLELGGTKVCARDCSFDGQCPSSYRCADGTDTNSAFVTKQCQPTSGTCECVASSAGQTKPCSETNAIGTCTGIQTCKPPNGYDACSATVPTAESCNGRDDNCNGMTDENLGETTCGTGECRRTVTNCINGSPQMCEPLPAGVEVCDEKDNNCNGVIDDGFDKMSVQHCGTCSNVCAFPHAVPGCMSPGMCVIASCVPGFVNADGIDSNGCELMCTPTGPEICDGVDNDCDGFTDEGFTLASDPTNCGICGRVCNVNNGNVSQYACVASQCGIMTCNTGFADCDQNYGTGCEKNVSADVLNCGGCNAVCTTPHATPACASSMCAIGSCDVGYTNCDNTVATGCEVHTIVDVNNCGTCGNICPARMNAVPTCVNNGCGFACNTGFTNLDGNPANGCEYSCTATGADDPDDTFTDQNCDGIDGDISRAIFVSITGNDLNPGTKDLPKLTVQAGINAASNAQPHVYVSAGIYVESVTLRAGISIYGGYAPVTWVRSAGSTGTIRSGTISNGRIVAMDGANITTATTVGYLTIQALDASVSGLGVSTYGLHCDTCSGLILHQAKISAGAGGTGALGGNGSTGTGGTGGINGNAGSCDGNNGTGGQGGTSACGRTGGRGGDGGATGRNVGSAGGQGVTSTAAGGGGSGGGGNCGFLCAGSCDVGGRGGDGTAGNPGAPGSNGVAGANGAVLASFWVGNKGGDGLVGNPGDGGGGGGGGGGQGGTCVIDGGGNGAGGGGAGGCGGTGAVGGGAGGSSFGLFLVNSNGVRIEACDLTSGIGGNGGAGGSGGAPGTGGGFGFGATTCTGEVGAGGNGGKGGDGGRGGHGGGGAGGYSYGLFKVNTTPTFAGTINYLHAAAGQGGTSSGTAGAPGLAADFN